MTGEQNKPRFCALPSNVGLGDAETLIANLYRARQKAKEGKRVWHERAAELECKNDCTEDGTSPCYHVYRYPEGAELWCDNCKSKTAHRKTYHAASAAAGAALNAVLRAGKKLASPNVQIEPPSQEAAKVGSNAGLGILTMER